MNHNSEGSYWCSCTTCLVRSQLEAARKAGHPRRAKVLMQKLAFLEARDYSELLLEQCEWIAASMVRVCVTLQPQDRLRTRLFKAVCAHMNRELLRREVSE